MTGFTVGSLQVGSAVKPDHLFDYFVRTVQMLVFEIEHWIDLMRLNKQPKPILEPKAGEKAALMSRMLPVEVDFRCPPFRRSIFDLRRISDECVDFARVAYDRI